MIDQNTFVFLPGGWHGAWAFDPIIEAFDRLGKKAAALTLPGLEEKPEEGKRIINLDTHIQFVIDFLIKENLTNVILCGHSYAGMVITGVADQVPGRIYGLIYIDAYIPSDGDSCWSLTSDEYRRRFVEGAAIDGFNVAVTPGSDVRRRPHPLASFMQALKLKGDYRNIARKAFIYLDGWEGSPFLKQYDELKDAPDWHVETIHSVHNVMKEHPEELVVALRRAKKVSAAKPV
jgi:pimeloyl-ACP methyl ester carboxylesterase